ncbi:MAG: MobF family relaxase [Sporichthyaceae bacterium]
MSLARLSAGSGYRYLLRNTAAGDVARASGQELTAYYAASGNPPGRWLGSGLAGLAQSGEAPTLVPGALVTEPGMAALYGAGHHPTTGEQLGRPYPAYKSAEQRIAEAIAGLPDSLSEPARAAAVAAIEARVGATPKRSAVAGFDLTFTVPKSASVLWALGDDAVRAAVVDAHRESIDVVLGLIEERFLFTRTGTNSCMQVDTRGLIAAAFDHFDSRTGDPNLHTHVVIANKVQGPDGIWRSVDAQVLYRAAVACSEVYDSLLADALATRLPVTWAHRDRGPRRTAAFEIDGLGDELLAAFSGRSHQIETDLDELVVEFAGTHGREPSRIEMLRLRQHATLTTRPTKHVHSLSELQARWARTASQLTGRSTEQIVTAALHDQPCSADSVDDAVAEMLAETVLTGIQTRRSTWTRANMLAEAARASRHLRLPTPQARLDLLDRVVDAALAGCIGLDPPVLFHSPARFRRADASSVFERNGDAAFTTAAVLDAEARLLAALDDDAAPTVPAAVTEPLGRPMPGQRLAPDQHAAIVGISGSGRRLDVLVGPAGTGKTRTLAILTRAWANAHGPGSVVGLAPSAAAAFALGNALDVQCETTAKWLHDNDPADPSCKRDPVAGTLAGQALRPGMLVILDEASLASTAHLDALLAHANSAGAKLLLVGDHRQLDAVDAGGAFALLAETATAQGRGHELHALWRFRNRWEAEATRALRTGEPAALDAYAERGRLHEGDTNAVTEAAYRAWSDDLAAGRTSLLLAADRDTVAALNLRARTDRLAGEGPAGPEALLHDGTRCSVGDRIVTRRNNRQIPVSGEGFVRNGANWTVAQVRPDGSLLAASDQPGSDTVHLPAGYVDEHVELGYATTIHRAQGATVDTAHAIATGVMDRRALYVALGRGREANHVYVATDGLADGEAHGREPHVSGRQILEQVLARDGGELSATATLRIRRDQSRSVARLRAIRDLLAPPGSPPSSDLDDVQALAELDQLVRSHRAAQSRGLSATPLPSSRREREAPGR